jgi:hypothetical protein
MTALAHAPDSSLRSSYQHQVAALLADIDRLRYQLYLRKTNGALPAGLRDQKAELNATRTQLAATLADRTQHAPTHA